MTASVRHLRNGAVFLFAICGVAMLGYMIAGWTLIDSAYMAIITVFSVGYGEVVPVEGTALRAFTMVFIVLGCTGYLYIGGSLVQYLIEGQIQTALGNRRMTRSIHHLKNHAIICGYGRVGRMLAGELQKASYPFVVIDNNEARALAIREEGLLCIHGDATAESTLIDAGIDKATQVAIVLPNDAANVFITLSARNLNENLSIIARGMAPSTEAKLIQAGANRVVLPEHIGAERIAGLILRPTTMTLAADGHLISQIASDLEDFGIDVDEYTVPSGSNIIGVTLAELETKGSSAFLIVTIVRADGEVISRPSLETVLKEGDVLISLSHAGKAPPFTELFNVQKKITYRGATIN